jgi:hypothetical protein
MRIEIPRPQESPFKAVLRRHKLTLDNLMSLFPGAADRPTWSRMLNGLCPMPASLNEGLRLLVAVLELPEDQGSESDV